MLANYMLMREEKLRCRIATKGDLEQLEDNLLIAMKRSRGASAFPYSRRKTRKDPVDWMKNQLSKSKITTPIASEIASDERELAPELEQELLAQNSNDSTRTVLEVLNRVESSLVEIGERLAQLEFNVRREKGDL
eukprot:m.179590 g.179590  ORF g.179590 m.179590 type:complete len:135 (+) comp39223_c1_seq2:3684-4088(+)